VAPAELLRDAVRRCAASVHEDRSGAGLEGGPLPDRRALSGTRVETGPAATTDPASSEVRTDVTGPVRGLLDDVRPLVAALASGPVTSARSGTPRERKAARWRLRAARTMLEKGVP
jgi:hypothetical protein